MSRRELGRWHSTNSAVWASLVIVTTPLGDHRSCMSEIVEVAIVQAFIAKLAVEAFNVGVLCWFARRDELQINAAAVGPIQSNARLVNSGPWSVRIAFGKPRN